MPKWLKIICGIFTAAIVLWFLINPFGKFGISMFAYTTFNCFPYIATDFQVDASGEVTKAEKIHDLKLEHIQSLLDSSPEVLIIATGWDGVTKVSDEIKNYKGCRIIIEKSAKAIEEYNKLI
ncbi:MAG: hypothetical protein ACYTFY_08330 [Planctomycetota bacterium]|jgi:hypothetical protein